MLSEVVIGQVLGTFISVTVLFGLVKMVYNSLVKRIDDIQMKQEKAELDIGTIKTEVAVIKNNCKNHGILVEP